MDAADVFRQGLGAMPPRQQPPFQYAQYPFQVSYPLPPQPGVPIPVPPPPSPSPSPSPSQFHLAPQPHMMPPQHPQHSHHPPHPQQIPMGHPMHPQMHMPPHIQHMPLMMPPQFRQPQQRAPPRLQPANPNEPVDETAAGRIAHTLTACCRCRQRKTRCDPTLPRCTPCERSGSVCEYFDASKGRKINRYYVIRLQDRVRALEAELNQLTDEDGEYPRDSEDVVRRGGMVRLNENDDTPRYLGPSSGIAMSRLVMERAKAYADKQRISDLIPEVRARRQARMQSIVMTNAPLRKKCYPMMSAHPAKTLPTRQVADKLVEMYRQKGQLFWPVLHETEFQQDLEKVYEGDNLDAHRNFIVRMVFAMSLQMMDATYAGLADSYYLAAMQELEEVVRAKDLRTLQCLLLLAQYSLLTPTRTAVYFTVGLAVRISQQEGLLDEKTIARGYTGNQMDPMTLDMRRRLGWAVAAMEFGLGLTMGRPNGIAKLGSLMDVELFTTVSDKDITPNGITKGAAADEQKLLAIHFFKMRMLQAEISRILYENQRDEIRDDGHPWFEQMLMQMEDWLNASPEKPTWSKAWFTGEFHQMRIFLYRPTPQVPSPSLRAVGLCHESATHVINLARQQMEQAAVDVTWVFMLSLYTAINTLLWSVSYPTTRQQHPREEVDEMINVALDILDRCAERWPGTQAASQMYSVLGKTILSSYDSKDNVCQNAFTPPSLNNLNSPPISEGGGSQSLQQQQQQQQQQQISRPDSSGFNNPFKQEFGFGPSDGAAPQVMFDENFPPHPTFRSNSIFHNPSSEGGRRNSFFPPDSADDMPPCTVPPQMGSSAQQIIDGLSHNQMDNAMSPPSTIGSFPIKQESSPTLNRSTPVQAPAQLTVTMATPPQAIPTPHMQTPQTIPSGPHPGPLPNRGPPQQQQYGLSVGGGVGLGVGLGVGIGLGGTMSLNNMQHQRPLPPAPGGNGNPQWFNQPTNMFTPQSQFNNNNNNNHYIAVGNSGGGPPGPGNFFPSTSGVTSAPMLLDGFPPSAPPAGAHTIDLDMDFGIDLGHMGVDLAGGPSQVAFSVDRHGSLNQEQQMELMDVLEQEGMNEIDAFLEMGHTGVGPGGAGIHGGMRWGEMPM